VNTIQDRADRHNTASVIALVLHLGFNLPEPLPHLLGFRRDVKAAFLFLAFTSTCQGLADVGFVARKRVL
jgi:hypothetical protein